MRATWLAGGGFTALGRYLTGRYLERGKICFEAPELVVAAVVVLELVRSDYVPFLAVVGLASEEGEGSRCEEKRVHVSEILPVGGAVLFMRDEDEVRAELDLSLPGRRAGYCLAGAAALRELWLVAGAGGCADWPREADAFARAALRCHRQEKREKIAGWQRGYRLLW